MQLHMLTTPEIAAVERPKSIQEIENYGDIQIVVTKENQDEITDIITGDHCIYEGSEEDFNKWLSPFECVFIGKGSPILQQFQAMKFGS